VVLVRLQSLFFALLMMCSCPRCWRSCSAGSPFRSRVTGVYLSIMTQALSYALMLGVLPATTWVSAATTASPTFKELLGYDLHQDSNTRRPVCRHRDRARRKLHRVPRHYGVARRPRDPRDPDAESRTRFLG